MNLVSINRAEPQILRVGNKDVTTGIFKLPIAGSVVINELGVEGDTIVNKKYHGGVDQAMYIYSAEDYLWWSEQLGREIEPGTFGENLTISAYHSGSLKVGDRLAINEGVILEITAPRVPCAQFATKMGDRTFGKKFVASRRPGAYARVISGGEISAGDQISWHPTNQDHASIEEIFLEWHNKAWSKEAALKALRSPISSIARRIIEERSGFTI